MKRIIKTFTSACFFLICYAPVPIVAGNVLWNDALLPLLLMAVIVPFCFLVAFVPGQVRIGKKQEVLTSQASRSKEANPDRALRSEEIPLSEATFPLRAAVCWVGCAAIAVGIFCLPLDVIALASMPSRLTMSVILAGMLPLALRMVVLNENSAGSVVSGVVLYMVGGIIAFFAEDADLERWLLNSGLLFIGLAVFALNNISMSEGTHSPDGVRPPAGMRQKNRLMLSIVVAIGAVTVYFDKIRITVAQAVKWIFERVWNVTLWILNQGTRRAVEVVEEEELTEEILEEIIEEGELLAEELQGDIGMEAIFGGETAPFWEESEQSLAIFCIIVVVVGLFFWGRKLLRLTKEMLKRFAAWLKKLSKSVGEEYQDEQESLLDWDEARRNLGDGLKKRLAGIFVQKPKWENMTLQERVRYAVRMMYHRTRNAEQMRSLTIQEAAPRLKTGDALPQEVADLYDTARYSQNEIGEEAVERLRKEAKV